MQLSLKNRRKWLLGGGLLLLTATPSFALFGIGDIVFDPTSYASLVSQLTTLQTQYTMLKNNIEHFSIKQQWQTTLTALKNANVKNMFGETNGMTTALNSNSPSASTTGWSAAIPRRPDAEYHRQQQPHSQPARWRSLHQQRSAATQPAQRGGSPEDVRDAVPGRLASLRRVADGCRQHAAAERRCY